MEPDRIARNRSRTRERVATQTDQARPSSVGPLLGRDATNIEVKILRNEQGKPAGKLADAEIHFIVGELAGLKLVGFAIWERRDGNGRRVTFPGRPLIVHGDKRNFELLRAIGIPNVLDHVRDLVLKAYEQQVQEPMHGVSQ